MKKIFLMGLFACLSLSLAFAQGEAVSAGKAPAADSAPAVTTLTGVIIDNACASAQKPEELAAFVKTHTKQCALMPACVASGYSIFANGKLYKFDKESAAKIEEFLKKEDSNLQVVVTAKATSAGLSLVAIDNQK